MFLAERTELEAEKGFEKLASPTVEKRGTNSTKSTKKTFVILEFSRHVGFVGGASARRCVRRGSGYSIGAGTHLLQ